VVPYHIGPASAAVPGVPLGLETAWKQFGSRPWRELIEPAIALARDGVELTPPQAYLHELLSGILLSRPEGRAIYTAEVGDRVRIPELADTLERLADEGAAALYNGELAQALCEVAPHISPDDLAGYRVIRRRPVSAPFRGFELRSNPAPSSGGILIAYGLRLLDGWNRFDPPAIVDAMREQAAAREGAFVTALYRGGLARRLIGPDAPTMTTHISTVDARGDAVAVSCSTGSGSGAFIPGTGVQLNNMLGEVDLAGLHRPGQRLTSMMAPTICLADGRPRLVVGSAGSARLRGAIFQIIVSVLARGEGVRDAVEAPRLHWDEGIVHAEGGWPPDDIDVFEKAGFAVTRWPRKDLFFGGAQAVELLEDGALAAAGDPRRGGAGIVVE